MVRRAVGVVLHADRVQRGVHAVVELRAPDTEVRGTERDVVARGGHEELVIGVLEHDADTPPHLLVVLPLDGERADPHRAHRRFEDPIEVQRERRLTRAVRAEQRDALAGLDAQT